MPGAGPAPLDAAARVDTCRDDEALRATPRKIVADRPRWADRRAHHELCQDGVINRKRFQRVWREEGGCRWLLGPQEAPGREPRDRRYAAARRASRSGVGAKVPGLALRGKASQDPRE